MAKTREDYKREQEEQALRDLSDLRYQGGKFHTTFNPDRIDEMTARPALDRDPRDQRSRADTYLTGMARWSLPALLLALFVYGLYGIVVGFLA